MPHPLRIINAVAPIRIADNGGWTDTWFAQYGKIFNIAVAPYAETQIEVFARDEQPERIVLYAENYGERYVVHPEQGQWDKHPLLEAAIQRMQMPDDVAVQVTIFSEAPAGASTGTSAAVTVALVGALSHLTPERLSAQQVAEIAHSIEVDMLKRQSGVQDQLCSAHGGVNFIDMRAYPMATVEPLELSDNVWWELERRLALIYLGKSHDSSQVHQKVIAELENAGPDAPPLNAMRACAERARDAVLGGDFVALGNTMRDNTEAQRRLNSALVGSDAQRVSEIAQAHGAIGWKVNGAGGEGGSLTILCGDVSHTKRAMLREIEQENALYRNIPIYLSRHGLRVWESPGMRVM